MGGKKKMLLYILRILEKYSDFDHPITTKEIISRLNGEYNMCAERKAVARNISLLMEMGYDICPYQENRKGYYLREREFEETELRLLIDSVMTSKYIPANDARRLIDKLKNLANVYFIQHFEHIHNVEGWIHQRNKEFFLALDLLDEAITLRKQAAFFYNQYGTDGELHPRRSEKDVVNPYQIVCANSQYYLIASYEGEDELRHFRIDKMTGPEVLEKDARSITKIPGYERGLDLARYAKEHNFMYGGKPRRIVLKMHKSRAGDVVDNFGRSARMRDLDDEYMEVCIYSVVEGIRYFALQFGCFCEALEPAELREMVKQDVMDMGRRYGV
jgi:predicted DNA-binding transcriptional regulator YafY